MDEQISMFCSFTSATHQQAQQYLALTDGNVEQAVELFFTSPDLGSAAPPASHPRTRPGGSDDPVVIDDDPMEVVEDDEDDVQITDSRPAPRSAPSIEDDEAMARKLQEEMYGALGGGGGAMMQDHVDGDGVRAPMARTTETLVGPDSDWRDNPGMMNAAIMEQLAARQQRRANPGIFNQQATRSIWTDGDPSDAEARRRLLARATGGASEQSSKSTMLADLFRPPFEIISPLGWSDAREQGKEEEKWILVNVQDPSIFDCQVLNRDIWKNPSIRDTINENFIFLQYNRDDPRGQEYIQYYFSAMRDSEDAYPYIAIVDPRTGEQVKTWSGSPAPKAPDFLMDLHEFLDRYSLSMEKKNPVQAKRKEQKKDVAQMSEEEMLEMALHNSLANGSNGPKEEDPDSLTLPPQAVQGKGKAPISVPQTSDAVDTSADHAANGLTAPARDTPFARISSARPHHEPTSTDPNETTRIQFRYSGGRVVRRFALSDHVRRIYEWLKATPLEGKNGAGFELISMGKNLMDMLDVPIGEAGLKNGTVMVEFVDGGEDA